MSARNIILAVAGLAVVAGGAAYFMLHGGETTSATDETAIVTPSSADEAAGATGDQAAMTAPEASDMTAESAPEETATSETTEEVGEPLSELAEDAADALGETDLNAEGYANAVVDQASETIDESLGEASEAPVENTEQPNE